ncbi:MAG: RnfABCDGE type electron transport complex subunit G [Anaerosomatales bacterium]
MAKRAASTPLNMIGAVLATCLVAASALTVTYELTRERIIEQERAAERAALDAVLPGTGSIESAEELVASATEAAGSVTLQGVYRAFDAAGVLSGWGVRVAPRGYSGPVSMVVGLDRDGSVLGVSIITMNETPGLGTKIVTQEGWIEQFVGWQGADMDASAREFDAIAGATRSSAAVRNGVTAAGRVYAEVLSAEEGGAQ